MNIIKFLSYFPLDNIISTLHFSPESLTLISYDENRLAYSKKNIEKVIKRHQIPTKIICRQVDILNYTEIFKTLYSLAEANPDTMFDLTGGHHHGLSAMGAVANQKNIPLCSFDLGSLKMLKLNSAGSFTQTPSAAYMSVYENILLHGGTICYSQNPLCGTYKLNLTSDFKNDILKIWNISKSDCSVWNSSIGTLYGAISSRSQSLGQQLETTTSEAAEHISHFQEKFPLMKDIISKLHRSGLITTYNLSDKKICITFKNEQVKYALTKSGTALELYTYITALTVSENSKPVFSSGSVGVVIDWDGIIYSRDLKSRKYGSIPDVVNEIDVLLMHNNIPIFISCKNGQVTSDELYKLSTVAERFGGKYARKILVITSFEIDSLLNQRAQEMNIKIVRNVHKMPQQDFAKALLNACDL